MNALRDGLAVVDPVDYLYPYSSPWKRALIAPVEKEHSLSYIVVDDDEEDRFLLRIALQVANRPLPALEFANGQQLLDHLTQNPTGSTDNRVNWVVVLDVSMPYLNGLETLKRLQQHPHWAKFPVVILSTSADRTLTEEFYVNGARGYVVKPNSSAKMVELFDQFIAPLLIRQP